jgi:uncharacterized membrane protein YagU involved in acid resistance
VNTISRGLWSGIFATSTMTLAFLEGFNKLPDRQRSPLPPGTITDDTLNLTGLKSITSSESRQNLSLLNHYGYGISLALLYSILNKKIKPSPHWGGAGYGALVWFASYLGLLPLMQYRSRATNMTLQRNLLMFSAHLIWGVTLGYSNQKLAAQGAQIFDGAKKSRAAE